MKENSDLEKAALEVLKSTGSDVLEAALVAKAALEAGGARLRQKGSLSGCAEVRASQASALRVLKRSKRIIVLGEEALRRQERTVSFAKAVEAALEARAGKRTRTQSDFRYITRRFMKRCPGLEARRVGPSLRKIARAILRWLLIRRGSGRRRA